MIVVDSSVVIACYRKEFPAEAFEELLFSAPCLIGWPSLIEVRMRLESIDPNKADALVDSLLSAPNITAADVTKNVFDFARLGFQLFGKGRHPAGLNIGDCFSYGLAKAWGAPLLFKGADFGKTDVAVHTAPMAT